MFVCSRGMRFENVNILTELIMDVIKDMRYCWLVSYEDCSDGCDVMMLLNTVAHTNINDHIGTCPVTGTSTHTNSQGPLHRPYLI